MAPTTPKPPAPRAGRKGGRKAGARDLRDRGTPGDPPRPDTRAHAREVREVVGGRDIVERSVRPREEVAAAFRAPEMLVVRSWLGRLPLEPALPPSALVAFPRMWTTRRGRYCRFASPGAGAYALLRARPTF